MSATRRDFLKSSLGAATLLALQPTVPAFLGRTAQAAASRRNGGDTVLIVLQLSGGNDGLNTVIPYDDDVYGRSRPTLRLTGNEVHKIDTGVGFHPEMRGFSRLFKEGHLGVVQGVAYPNGDRDHPTALHIYHTGRPHVANCQTGWLGRAIDQAAARGKATVPGALVGAIPQPLALNAEKSVVPSIPTLAVATGGNAPPAVRHAGRRLVEVARKDVPGDDPLLDFVRRTSLEAYTSADKIEAVARDVGGAADYPPFSLAKDLRTIAQLIRADLGIRIFFAELGGGGIGGFDNHAGQRDNHAALLRQLSGSVAALVDDLNRDKLLDRVLLMTFSEFGRTVTENGRRGTGHGTTQPIFLAGGRLKGGLIGAHPSLENLDQDAPRHHTDFRRVYATALEQWLGLDSRAVLHGKFKPVDMLQI